jgi:hypothetical protein
MNQVRKKVAGQGLMPRHQYEVACPACTPPLIATERPRPLNARAGQRSRVSSEATERAANALR